MKKFLVFLILLAIVGFGAYFFLFGKKDICKNVVPEDAKAVMLLDAKQAIKQMDFSISDIFKALKHQKEDNTEEWGIDMLSPMYGFVSNDNYVGGVFALSDADDFEEKISKENIPVETQRGFKWGNKGEILICFDSKKALIIGPVTKSESDRMRGKMVEWMNQGSHKIPIMSSLKYDDGVMSFRSSLGVLPSSMTNQVVQYLHNVDLDNVFLNATLNVKEKAFVLTSELDSQDENFSKSVSEFGEFLRPIEGDMLPNNISNPIAHIVINVQGEKLLKKLRENPVIRMMLVAVNLCIDTDMMIKAIDGNVSFEIGNDASRETVLVMNAKTKNQDFLKNAKDWCSGGATLGYSCQALDDKNFVLNNNSKNFFFGVDGDYLYVSSVNHNSPVFSEKKSFAYEQLTGKRYYSSLDIDKMYNFIFGNGIADESYKNPAGLDHLNISFSDLSHFQIELTTKGKTLDVIKQLLK